MMDEALGQILQLYAQARKTTDSTACMEVSEDWSGGGMVPCGPNGTSVCRYCAGRWQRWEGSKLDGHAACVVTEAFKIQLAEVMRANPSISIKQVASVLDMSSQIVRSWHQVGLSRLMEMDRKTKKKTQVIEVWKQKPGDAT